MSQHENRHWTYESSGRKLEDMTAIAPTSQLTDLIAGVRSAVDSHADWSHTADLVTEQLRRHLPTVDVLTAEQQAGAPEHATSHTLHVEPDGTFSIIAVIWRPGQLTRIHDHLTWCVFGVIQGVEHEELYDAELNLLGEQRQPDRRRQRLRTARRHPPRAQHLRHHRDLDPHLRHRRHARRLQRAPLLRLTRSSPPG